MNNSRLATAGRDQDCMNTLLVVLLVIGAFWAGWFSEPLYQPPRYWPGCAVVVLLLALVIYWS
jgi:hypothetical protein